MSTTGATRCQRWHIVAGGRREDGAKVDSAELGTTTDERRMGIIILIELVAG